MGYEQTERILTYQHNIVIVHCRAERRQNAQFFFIDYS